jgi:hypothetical protein
VTPGHPVWHLGQWVPAFQYPGAEHVTGQPGHKVSLSIDADSFDERNFILYGPDDSRLTVHNPVLPRS